MKKLVVFLFFFHLTLYVYSGGCEVPTFKTSNGLYGDLFTQHTFSVFVIPTDSFDISIIQRHCPYIIGSSISFNGQILLANNGGGPLTGRFACKPGTYELRTSTVSPPVNCMWTLILIAKPLVPDTVTIDTAGVISHTTALSQVKILNPEFLLYPNRHTIY